MNNSLKKLPFFLPFGGCRGRCVYCNQQTITGAEELPSPDFVRSALCELKEPREICYFGGSFCRFGRETVKAYLDAVTECAPAGSSIRFSTYPGDLSETSFRRFIMSYPISRIELGLPSLDPKVLDSCRRDADPKAILAGIKTLRDEGVPLAVQMMIGLPGQTAESSLADLRTLAEIKGSLSWQLRLYPCLVIEGTELFDMMNNSTYTPLPLKEAVLWGGRFIDEALSLGFVPIRVGLQETLSLASAVRGGPHHPALGELIFSEALVRRLVREKPSGPWNAALRDISKITGHGGYGLSRLGELTGKSTTEIKSLLSFLSE